LWCLFEWSSCIRYRSSIEAVMCDPGSVVVDMHAAFLAPQCLSPIQPGCHFIPEDAHSNRQPIIPMFVLEEGSGRKAK
jgi:hypothetical protein